MTNRTPYSKLECCAQGVILHRGHRMSDVIGIIGIIDNLAYRLYRRRGSFPCLGKHAGIGRKATGRCRQDCVHTCPDTLPVSQPFPRNGLPANCLITAICHQVSSPCSDKDRSQCPTAQDTPRDNGTHCYNFTTNFNPLQPAFVVLLPSRARPLVLADLRRKHGFHELLVAQTLELFVLLMIFFLNLRQAFFCQLEFGIVEFLGGGYRGLVAIDNI